MRALPSAKPRSSRMKSMPRRFCVSSTFAHGRAHCRCRRRCLCKMLPLLRLPSRPWRMLPRLINQIGLSCHTDHRSHAYIDPCEIRLPTKQMKPCLVKGRQLGSCLESPDVAAGDPCQAAGQDDSLDEDDAEAPPLKKARRSKTRRVSRF